MSTKDLYFYDNENRLESRNTYFYSSYAGRRFVASWRASRSKLLDSAVVHETQENFVESVNLGAGIIKAYRLLSYIQGSYREERHEQASLYLKILVKRFEVTKRIYQDYDRELRAVNKNDYRNLDLYLRFSEVLATAYESEQKLPYLNALLKVIDTLSSVSDKLTASERQRLSAIAKKEVFFIEELWEKIGLEEPCG